MKLKKNPLEILWGKNKRDYHILDFCRIECKTLSKGDLKKQIYVQLKKRSYQDFIGNKY